MTSEYPVHVEVTSPPRYDRWQLVIRILFAMVFGAIGITYGWIACILFTSLPLLAAITATRTPKDPDDDVAPLLWTGLRYLLQVSTYMLLLADRFPTRSTDPARITIRFTGTPTVTSALWRLVSSIPSGIVLCLLWMISGVLWIVGALTILIARRVPSSILAFQRGVLRWQTRLVAYHASLVDEYPPFDFDTDLDDVGSLPAARVS